MRRSTFQAYDNYYITTSYFFGARYADIVFFKEI